MNNNKSIVQLVWGWALFLVGIGVFFRIPQIVPKIEQIKQYAQVMPYIKFCLYMLGIFLVAGGARKIYHYYKKGQGT